VEQCIWTIRRTLQDTASAPRYIKTVRGYGYRFVGLPRVAQGANVQAPVVGSQARKSNR
jgi:DNA-binding winged helix-turn-helix (wHTH) protein